MFAFERGPIKLIQGGRYPECHSVFIDDDLRAVIDASSDADVLSRLDAERPIQVLMATHGHEDHILHNHLFPKAALWVHALEARMFRDTEGFLHILAQEERTDEARVERILAYLDETVHFTPREPDRLLADGETIDFGRTMAEVLHTPGHSPGHLCFYFPREKVLFTGDLDLHRAGPYYGDPESSIEDTIRSCRRLAQIPAEVYLTAHGRSGVLEADPAHFDRYLAVIDDREARLCEFLKAGPRTLAEIAGAGLIYGNKSIEGAWSLTISERTMMRKHLERLIEQGAVVQEGERFRLG